MDGIRRQAVHLSASTSATTGTPRGRLTFPWLVLLVAAAGAANGVAEVAPGRFSLRLSDQFAYAAAARSLAEGRGLQSSELRAYAMAVADQNGVTVTRATPIPPDLFSAGWPLLLAAAFRAFGSSDVVYQGLNVALYAALAVVMYLFGQALGGTWGGLAAAALLLCHARFLADGFAVGMEIPYALLALAAALCLYTRSGPGSAAAAGVLLGYAYAMRPTAICLLPLGLLALLGRGDRVSLGRLGAFGGALILVVVVIGHVGETLRPVPLVPGRSVSYTAQALLYETETYPGNTVQHKAVLPTWQDVLALRAQVLRKLVRGLFDAARTSAEACPGPVLALAPLGVLLATHRRRRTDVLALAILTSGLALAVLASLTFPDSMVRYELPAGVLAVPLAGAGLVHVRAELRSRWGRWSSLAIILILLIVAVPRAIQAHRALSLGAHGNASREMASSIRDVCAPGGLVAAHDVEGARLRALIGWYARCRSVSLDGSAGEVVRLLQQRVEADAFITYLSDPTFQATGRAPEAWVPGFRLVKRLKAQTAERGTQELGLWVPDGGASHGREG